jgi:glycosyltransferase involved in cell wall biosynthesis
MTKMRYAEKIAIIGPYPPPYGGISVHIERILQHIPQNKVDFFNTEKRSNFKGKVFYGWRKYWYLFLFLIKPYKIIHYHSTSAKIRILLALVGSLKSTVYLHSHGESLSDTLKGKGLTARLTRFLIRYVHILASNSDLTKFLSQYNSRSLQEIDAFLPPLIDENLIDAWFQRIKLPTSKCIISMIGWFNLYRSEDLYGYDLLLEALSTLRKKYIDAIVLASVNGINDERLYNNFLVRRKKLELEKYFILLEDEFKEIYPLYLHSDIFIRPTNSDGSAMSVKEALWFGCRVIASNAVPRPAGVYLFENRNSQDLTNKILYLIEKNDFIPLPKKLELAQEKKFCHPLITEIYGLE